MIGLYYTQYSVWFSGLIGSEYSTIPSTRMSFDYMYYFDQVGLWNFSDNLSEGLGYFDWGSWTNLSEDWDNLSETPGQFLVIFRPRTYDLPWCNWGLPSTRTSKYMYYFDQVGLGNFSDNLSGVSDEIYPGPGIICPRLGDIFSCTCTCTPSTWNFLLLYFISPMCVSFVFMIETPNYTI